MSVDDRERDRGPGDDSVREENPSRRIGVQPENTDYPGRGGHEPLE